MNIRENIAAVQHDIWAHWMAYLFTCATLNEDGSFTITADMAKRWQRQVSTLYGDLTEKEKDSDRDQADKILNVFAISLSERPPLKIDNGKDLIK